MLARPAKRPRGASAARGPAAALGGAVRRVHAFAWIWEPLEADPTFVLRSMFGSKVVYLDGRLALGFVEKRKPWRGVLVCTDRAHHASLRAEFPELVPHPVLPKWLYLDDSLDAFERVAQALAGLARARDPRIGIAAKSRSRGPR